jgi:hypothetical protein
LQVPEYLIQRALFPLQLFYCRLLLPHKQLRGGRCICALSRARNASAALWLGTIALGSYISVRPKQPTAVNGIPTFMRFRRHDSHATATLDLRIAVTDSAFGGSSPGGRGARNRKSDMVGGVFATSLGSARDLLDHGPGQYWRDVSRRMAV